MELIGIDEPKWIDEPHLLILKKGEHTIFILNNFVIKDNQAKKIEINLL